MQKSLHSTWVWIDWWRGTAMEGRLSFKQYISNKRSLVGIKLFSSYESSGYLQNLQVCLGKNGLIKETDK